MKSSRIRGRLVRQRNEFDALEAIEGEIWFIPSRPWVYQEGECWAVLSPRVELIDGCFEVELSRTDQGAVPFFYHVQSPTCTWDIVIEKGGVLQLQDLLT